MNAVVDEQQLYPSETSTCRLSKYKLLALAQGLEEVLVSKTWKATIKMRRTLLSDW